MSISSAMPEVNATEAAKRIAEGAFTLDVREKLEWDAGHIGSAVHIPLGELVSRHNEISSDRDILVFCRSGGRSAEATLVLCALGYKAHNVVGGMQAWVAAGEPIDPESGVVL